MLNKTDTDLVVFGAGLMRTGTMSLQKALEILLEGRCYHGADFLQLSNHLELWEKAVDNGNLTKDEWRQLYKGCVAALDAPTCLFYDRLAEAFPDAKVILSVRDPDDWESSMRSTVRNLVDGCYRFPLNVIIFFTPFRSMPRVLYKMRRFGNSTYDLPLDVPWGADFFRRHVERVKSVVPSERLLVFKASDGWGPLCEFLDLPVPEVPFPNINDRGGYASNAIRPFRMQMVKSAACWIMVGGVTALLAYHFLFCYRGNDQDTVVGRALSWFSLS